MLLQQQLQSVCIKCCLKGSGEEKIWGAQGTTARPSSDQLLSRQSQLKVKPRYSNSLHVDDDVLLHTKMRHALWLVRMFIHGRLK